jgi:hypothetical protein
MQLKKAFQRRLGPGGLLETVVGVSIYHKYTQASCAEAGSELTNCDQN